MFVRVAYDPGFYIFDLDTNEPIEFVEMCDSDTGSVRRVLLDENGNPKLSGTEFLTVTEKRRFRVTAGVDGPEVCRTHDRMDAFDAVRSIVGR